MYFRKVVMLNLFVSLIMSQEQLGSDIDGEAAQDDSGYSVSLDSDGSRYRSIWLMIMVVG